MPVFLKSGVVRAARRLVGDKLPVAHAPDPCRKQVPDLFAVAHNKEVGMNMLCNVELFVRHVGVKFFKHVPFRPDDGPVSGLWTVRDTEIKLVVNHDLNNSADRGNKIVSVVVAVHKNLAITHAVQELANN